MGDIDLSGRVAFITGARRGIGRGIARRLAAHGASVVLAARLEGEEGIDDTVATIRAAGGKAAAIAFDLADPEARADAVERAAAAFGPIDILVNNAATNDQTYLPPSTMSLAVRQRIFEVNVHAPVDLIQQALPLMRERGWGRILNIVSETIRQPPAPYPGPAKYVDGLVLYGASKAALERYTFGLSAELMGSGIHVNATYPYRVCVTEMNSPAAKQALKAHPDWAEPVEMMAEAALALIGRDLNGLSINSRALLQMLGQPLFALDGTTMIGDGLTLADLD